MRARASLCARVHACVHTRMRMCVIVRVCACARAGSCTTHAPVLHGDAVRQGRVAEVLQRRHRARTVPAALHHQSHRACACGCECEAVLRQCRRLADGQAMPPTTATLRLQHSTARCGPPQPQLQPQPAGAARRVAVRRTAEHHAQRGRVHSTGCTAPARRAGVAARPLAAHCGWRPESACSSTASKCPVSTGEYAVYRWVPVEHAAYPAIP